MAFPKATAKPQNHSEEKHQADNLALKDDHEAGNGEHHGTLKLYTERFERNRGSAWIPIGKSIFKADWRQNTEMRFK